jgi:hypothetical protein
VGLRYTLEMEATNFASLEEILRVLNELREMAVLVRVNLGFPNTCISFEGRVTTADSESIQIDAIEGNKHIAIYRVSPLEVFDIFGGFAKTGEILHLSLTVVRKGNFENLQMPRTSLSAQWPLPQAEPGRVN